MSSIRQPTVIGIERQEPLGRLAQCVLCIDPLLGHPHKTQRQVVDGDTLCHTHGLLVYKPEDKRSPAYGLVHPTH